MKHRYWVIAAAVIYSTPAMADSTEARCDIYPAGSDKVEKMLPCTFSQRQGFISIARNDDIRYELSPSGDAVGNFKDQQGRIVYRQSGLGDQGLIFRFPDISVFVYWSTAGLEPSDKDNPTAPFVTKDYDATTLLRCRGSGQTDFGTCAAGILRMEDGQASVVVLSPKGQAIHD